MISIMCMTVIYLPVIAEYLVCRCYTKLMVSLTRTMTYCSVICPGPCINATIHYCVYSSPKVCSPVPPVDASLHVISVLVLYMCSKMLKLLEFSIF